MPITDPHAGFANISSQGDSWGAITPSDVAQLAVRPKALWIGVGGTLALQGGDGVSVTFTVAAGALLPFRPVAVLSTGTTATGIVGIY